jgi:hypothetical protein
MPVALVDATLSPRRRQRIHRKQPTEDSSSSSSSDSSDDEDDDAHVRDVIRTHALKYYQRHHGEDAAGTWGEDTEASVQKEMLRRWRESEWGQVLRGKRRGAGTGKGKPPTRWVGSSFTVGRLPGLDIAESSRASPIPSADTGSGQPAGSAPTIGASTMQTFVTAPSALTPDDSTDRAPSEFTKADIAPSTSSTTALVRASSSASKPATLGLRSALVPQLSELRNSAQSESQVPTLKKGKGKTVRYAEPEPPAPPGAVLARTGSAVADTSAGAVEEATAEVDVEWGEITLQGRFLPVRRASVCSQPSLHRPADGPRVPLQARDRRRLRRGAEPRRARDHVRAVGRVPRHLAQGPARVVRGLRTPCPPPRPCPLSSGVQRRRTRSRAG